MPRAASAIPSSAWRALAAGRRVRLAVTEFEAAAPHAARIAGRQAAALCFEQFGLPGSPPVQRADDGRAIWPAGFIGSISHRMGVAVAALAHQPPVVAIGIDLEQARALAAEDAALVLSAAEWSRLDNHPDPDALATVLWSAKEAAFKAWSTALGGLPDVDPVEIMVVPDDAASVAFGTTEVVSSFVVQAAGALAGRVSPIGALSGFVHVSDGWVFSIVTDPTVRP